MQAEIIILSVKFHLSTSSNSRKAALDFQVMQVEITTHSVKFHSSRISNSSKAARFNQSKASQAKTMFRSSQGLKL
jgi:hypothetical protein